MCREYKHPESARSEWDQVPHSNFSVFVRHGGPRTGLCSSDTPDTSAEYFQVGKTSEVSKLYSSPAPDSSLTPVLSLLNQKLTPGKLVRLVLRMLCKTTENLSSFIAVTLPPFSGAHARAFSVLGTHVLQNASFPRSSLLKLPSPLGKDTLRRSSLHALALSYTRNPVIAVFRLP